MDNASNINMPEQQEKEQRQKPQWYDAVIHIFQELLEFNQHIYTTKKVPRL